jgi:hypothetical protein
VLKELDDMCGSQPHAFPLGLGIWFMSQSYRVKELFLCCKYCCYTGAANTGATVTGVKIDNTKPLNTQVPWKPFLVACFRL